MALNRKEPEFMQSGLELRLARLFNGKKNLVISAVDHVTEYGYQEGLESIETALANCRTVDAMLLPRVMLERNWRHFAAPGSPVPVVRINWSASFYYPLAYREGETTIATTVEEAVRAGAGVAVPPAKGVRAGREGFGVCSSTGLGFSSESKMNALSLRLIAGKSQKNTKCFSHLPF